MFKTILFDFDGTLVDTMPAIVHATQLAFEHKGLRVPDDVAVRGAVSSGLGIGHALRALHPAVDPGELDAWALEWRRIYYGEKAFSRASLFPGAKQVLRDCKALGLRVAIVTNMSAGPLVKAVDAYGLAEYVDCLVGEEAGQPKKPLAEVFTNRVRTCLPEAEAATTLMVGDSSADLQFANNIGAKACWASYGFGDREQCLAQSPAHVIGSLDQLGDLLRSEHPASLASRAAQAYTPRFTAAARFTSRPVRIFLKFSAPSGGRFRHGQTRRSGSYFRRRPAVARLLRGHPGRH